MSYVPNPLTSTEPEAVQQYLLNEFRRISEEINGILNLDVLHTEPDKPRDGMIRFFDGTNAGTSVGLHEYHTGAWNKL